MQNERVNEVFEYLAKLIPDPRCELDYVTDIDLLVAVILSAQCTDRRVNAVTKRLFAKYRTAGDYAGADLDELMAEIRSCGFYRTKARNIQKMARDVVAKHGGVVPSNLDDLIKLAGVGRKTASVFLSEFYGVPAIAVDTHVMRVSRRLGFTTSRNPDIIQRDLMKLFDEKNWGMYHKYLVLFGRYYCKAQRPTCGDCGLKNYCTENLIKK